MSKASLDAMAPGDRDLVRDVARRSVQVMRTEWDERETKARETVIADGIHVHPTAIVDAAAAQVSPVGAPPYVHGESERLVRPVLFALQRGLHLLNWLAHEGAICQGPRHGKQPTFVLMDAWVPPSAPLGPDEALR